MHHGYPEEAESPVGDNEALAADEADANSETTAADNTAHDFAAQPASIARSDDEPSWQDDEFAAALFSVAQPEEPDYPESHHDADAGRQPPLPLGAVMPGQRSQARVGRPLSRHFTLWTWSGIILAAILWAAGSAGYYFLNYFGASPTGFSFYWTHQPSELNRYIADYNMHEPLSDETLHWYVWSDTGKPVTPADLKYKPALPSSLAASASIPRSGLLPGTRAQRTGTQYLLFPRYQIAVTPQKLELQTDAQGLALSVAGSDAGTSDPGSTTLSLDHVFPGSYDVTAKGTLNQVQIDLKRTVTATTGNAQADFALQFVTFHLYSNISNADVYVGDSKIGILSGGDYKFNQIPALAGQRLHVQKTFGDGVVKTKSVPVSGITDGSSIYLDWDQELTQNAANSLFSNAQTILSNMSGGYAADDAASVFDGGTGNSAYARFMQDSVTDIKSPILGGFMPSSIAFNGATVNTIVQSGVNTYDVTWSMTWDFNFSHVLNQAGTQYAAGDFVQNHRYVSQVAYVPGGNASIEGTAVDGSNEQGDQSDGPSGSDDAETYAAGNDPANFRITSLDDDITIANITNDVILRSTD